MLARWLESCKPAFMPPYWSEFVGDPVTRAVLAAGLVWLLARLCGPRCIDWLARRFREPIVSDSPRLQALHQAKAWTPTMGGLFLLLGIAIGTLLLGEISNTYLWLSLYVATGLAAVGAVDDLRKLRSGRTGMSARTKVLAQTIVVIPAAVVLAVWRVAELDTPHATVGALQAGWLLIPWMTMVIVGTSNAVNLTDGLDGLAGGCLLVALLALAALIAQVPGDGFDTPREGVVLCGAAIGALAGFLRFNRHPARVFMGNTGSLALGGLLGCLALTVRQELWLLVIGGVFVVETLSVIVQVASFRWLGRRVLLCAPLHHHFQFQSLAERKIVPRFWLAAVCCGAIGLAGGSFTKSSPAVSQRVVDLHPTAVAARESWSIALTFRGKEGAGRSQDSSTWSESP